MRPAVAVAPYRQVENFQPDDDGARRVSEALRLIHDLSANERSFAEQTTTRGVASSQYGAEHGGINHCQPSSKVLVGSVIRANRLR